MQPTLVLSLLFVLFAPPGALASSPTKMRALLMTDYGGSEVLRIGEASVPMPSSGEVQIRIHAAGVNPVDWKIRAGRLQRTSPVTLPYIPGRDVAGIIRSVGPGVTRWKVGDSVIAVLDGGGFAEYVNVPVENVAPKPAKLSFEEAAGIPTASLAAWRTLIVNADIKQGQRVLIHGGAGGVGSTAVQLAHWRGAHVITTASERNHEYLKALGADEVIDYRTTRFEDVVKNVDVVLDTVGGETLQRSPAVLRQGGTLLTIVGRPPAEACSERKLRCPSPSTATRAQPGEELAELGKLFDQGTLKMNLDARFPLEQATKALELSEGGHARGKIIVVVVD
ncbi:NADP-dependent oxidoreductase [Steroidobacter sp. S1-65]|uniref:NADP-dependent oxidoreductase n=1 Tax=Steroidobacter gossypii TaxID=2805490 RepID=A0ABS1X2E4_9GAMM|nr:NADP-dependent oxidoreductase [Steroidobacter gossypii]MBM0107396.1 NADP-dependent oxidoreductase [Steroidobacter gossypii]